MKKNQDRGITDELINEILDIVLLQLPVKETDVDYDKVISILTIYINAICLKLLIKTNRRMFIPDLKYVVSDLVVNQYINYLGNLNVLNAVNADGTISQIQSMSEAGRSVTYGTAEVSNISASKLNLLAEKQLEENEA